MNHTFLKLSFLSTILGCLSPLAFSSCLELRDLKLPHSAITQAEPIPAGDFHAPDGNTYKLPDFCRVQGVSKPNKHSKIKFEVWLPSSDWNMRYYQHGQGGEAGQISYSALAGYLKEGSVVGATDDGHTAVLGAPYTWALNAPEKIIDWGYRALKETSDAAQVITQQFYRQSAHYRYFSGCSRGGQQALTAAQRYPEDWDGVLAGAPDIYLSETIFSFMHRGGRWKYQPKGRIPVAMLPVIQSAALKSCTIKAHVIDGIATNPQYCAFDPAVLACTNESSDNCLTSEQISTLQEIYTGPKDNETLQSIYPGYPSTMETNWGMSMPIEDPKNKEGENFLLSVGEAVYRNIVFNNPLWQSKQWRYKDLAETRIRGEYLPTIVNAENPDLRRFKEKNGKIMMYFGWSDAAIPPASGIKYYDEVVKTMGGISSTNDFFRLFMAPGMNHCAGGPGANAFSQHPLPTVQSPVDDSGHSVVRALEYWVEEGKTPKKIIATKYQQDDPKKGVLFTRTLCPYPEYAIYVKGNTEEASSYDCRAPTE